MNKILSTLAVVALFAVAPLASAGHHESCHKAKDDTCHAEMCATKCDTVCKKHCDEH